MIQPGKLFGIGVGPGDPELMTLKAARLLALSAVVAYFRKRGHMGHARTIIASHLPSGVEELPLEYPMTTEIPSQDNAYSGALTAFYDEVAKAIAVRLVRGQDVALVCEGDPFFYGSFMHIYHRLSSTYSIEVVPGITGMQACWTQAGTPITYSDDVLQVLPGTMPEAALIERMRIADALVIMKLGRNFAKVRRSLTAAGLADRAIYVERGSMAGEVVTPLTAKEDDIAPYFSMILVPGRGRCL